MSTQNLIRSYCKVRQAARYHRYIMDAFDLRNAGDYGSMHAVDSEKAQQTINDAREFYGVIK